MDIKKEHELFLRNLDKDLVKSVKRYTSEEFEVINAELRSGKSLSSRTRKIVSDIDSIFGMIKPIKTPLTLYRGVKELIKSHDNAFISATYDKDVALSFTSTVSKCCLVEFLVPVGSKVLYVESISESPSESEVLLDRNGTFFVTAIEVAKTDDEKDIIYINYIPPRAVEVEEDTIETAIEQINVIERIVDIFPEDEFLIFSDDEAFLLNSINNIFQRITNSKNNIDESTARVIIEKLNEKY